jgi:hypothetical protein
MVLKTFEKENFVMFVAKLAQEHLAKLIQL